MTATRRSLAATAGLSLLAAAPAQAGTPGHPTLRTRDGVTLFHRDWGSGPPVVFLASWSLPSDSWAYQMLPLSEAGLRCVAFDRRGHGRSQDPGRGHDYDTLADDLAAVMETLDLRGATLVGFSMGCGEVIRYLTRHGTARVARIALIGTTTPALTRAPDNPQGVDPAVFERFRQEWLLRDFPGWVDANMEPFVTPETPPGIRDWVRDMALRSSLHALLHGHRAITGADFRAELRRIAIPALLIHGARDQTSPLALTAQPTAALLPRARLSVYDDAPHGLPYTHRDRLNAELLGFIRAG